MTNKELKEKIAHLETELAEVKEMAEEMKKRADGGGAFKPKDRQTYWFVSESGEVYQSMWCVDLDDHSRYAIGNCHLTKQSAEDTVRALKLIQKARESQNGFVPDWENREQRKFYLYFNDNGTWTGTNFLVNVTPIFGYWEDESACEQFVDENHDEILWFFTEYRR